jgi:hypothetical protein
MKTTLKILVCGILILLTLGCRAKPTYSERCWATEFVSNAKSNPSIVSEVSTFAGSLGLHVDLQRPGSVSAYFGQLRNQDYVLHYDGPLTEVRGELSIFFYRDIPNKSEVLARFDEFVKALLKKNIDLKRCADIPEYVPSIMYR